MDIRAILSEAVKMGASDVFMVSGAALSCKIQGKIIKDEKSFLSTEDTKSLVFQLLELAGIGESWVDNYRNEMDFSFSMAGVGRFRANLYRQRGSFAAVLRCVPFDLPNAQELGIPEQVMSLADSKNGIVLITGSAGNGKSTTLSCMIDRINSTRSGHIITIEDPIEYRYEQDKATIHQREIGRDVSTFDYALRSALREDPDVILIGEMRDYETISLAMTAAETGHLVFGTLHTSSAAQTIDRIIDVCPSNAQEQVRTQLANMIQGIIAQTLVPAADNKTRCAAVEVMLGTDAIKNLIRSNKVAQMETTMQGSSMQGMQTLIESLNKLYKAGKITYQTAIEYSNNPAEMEKKMLNG